MATNDSYTSSQGSHYSTSPSASSVASGATSPVSPNFSVFQEGPGQALVFSPPRGTPELQRLVDLFITLDIPASMKMDMIQRDFETHSQRTGERYKTYFVPAAVAATPTVSSTAVIASPATLTASPSPMFPSVFDAAFSAAASVSGGSGSGSGSFYMDASPAPRSSPSESELTDPLFPLSVPMIPTNYAAAFHNVASATPSWQAPVSASSSSSSISRPQHRLQHRQSSSRRPLSGSSSMKILTRTGEDVTHVSSRSTRTREERENTRLVRQRGACPECRRKKTRCSPGHAGATFERVDRATPYPAPAQSGRAKEDVTTDREAKASKSKAEGKRPAAQPAVFAPQTSSIILSGSHEAGGDGGGGGVGLTMSADATAWATFHDSFDWAQLSNEGHLFTDEELDLDLAASLTAAEAASSLLAEAPVFSLASTVGALPPQSRVPHDSRAFAAVQSQVPHFPATAAGGELQGQQQSECRISARSEPASSGLVGRLAGLMPAPYAAASSSLPAYSAASSSQSSTALSSPAQPSLYTSEQFSTLPSSAAQQDSSRAGYNAAGTATPALASQQLFSYSDANTGQSEDFGGFGGFGGFSGNTGVFAGAGLAGDAITDGGRIGGGGIIGGDIFGGSIVNSHTEATTGGLSSNGLASGLSDAGVSGGLAQSAAEQGGLERLESGAEGDSSRSSEASPSTESNAGSHVRSGHAEEELQQQRPTHQRLPRDFQQDLQSGGSVESGCSSSSGGNAGLNEAAGSSSDVSSSLLTSVSSQTGAAAGDTWSDRRDVRMLRRRPGTTTVSASAGTSQEPARQEMVHEQEEEEEVLRQLSEPASSSSSAFYAGDSVERGVQLSTEKDAAALLAGMATLVSSLLPSLLVWAATHPSSQASSKYHSRPQSMVSGSLAVACH